MKKAWSLSNDKAIINFSVLYCTSVEEVIDSEGFRNVLKHFLDKEEKQASKTYFLVEEISGSDMREDQVKFLKSLAKVLRAMNSEEAAATFPSYSFIFEKKSDIRKLIEEIYNYWRSLERYCLITENAPQGGLASSSFIEAKETFDNLILHMYRRISNNCSGTSPSVYRQVPAGTNAGMILKHYIWPIPEGYEVLRGIPFIKSIVLEAPFITYPKKNTRSGIFQELGENPITRIGMNADHFFCYPAKVGKLLAYIYVHRDFITHGISLSNLFELATEEETAGRKPDLIFVYGGSNHDEGPEDVYYVDEKNEIVMGFISKYVEFDYFGYMKKMVLTLHNVHQIIYGNLPIHGAMVNVKLKSGNRANIVIMGDSGAGKSESIEAFRSLAEEYISDMTIIFDDMGTFSLDKETGRIKAYGTEIGAFVRLDDLDTGYAFKELDRSIYMNPDKTNARLITPVSSYDEISQGYYVDIFLYANNYDELKEGENAIRRFEDKDEAIKVFKAGKRMAKGTTSEEGLTSSYFANPFGPTQRKEDCDPLIESYFQALYDQGTFVGEMRTQLGIGKMVKEGPQKAAIDLFNMIKKGFKN